VGNKLLEIKKVEIYEDRDVEDYSRSDDFLDGYHEFPGQFLKLPLAELLWVHCDAALCTSEGNVHDSCLPSHQRCETEKRWIDKLIQDT